MNLQLEIKIHVKMKNKNRIQILQQMVNKSDQIMDDIIKVTMQIYATQPKLYMHLNDLDTKLRLTTENIK
jgi:hypothetical protein